MVPHLFDACLVAPPNVPLPGKPIQEYLGQTAQAWLSAAPMTHIMHIMLSACRPWLSAVAVDLLQENDTTYVFHAKPIDMTYSNSNSSIICRV